ncbi:MAG: MerR family transcriptional regulator [Chloroflexota bacterium]
MTNLIGIVEGMEMSIGEVAEIAEVATSTLRYYEEIGLIAPPKRVNGRRRFTPAILPILALIQLAKDANFTLDEIKELLYDFPAEMPVSERWQTIAQRKIKEVEQMIREAESTKALLEESLNCLHLHFELDDGIQLPEPSQ